MTGITGVRTVTPFAPISLYIELEEGRRADLDVVARASLAFTAALREAAYVLDPSVEIRIELVSGTEGSLSLNSLISGVKTKLSKKTLIALMLLAGGWFCNEVGGWVVGAIMDAIVDAPDDPARLTEEEIDRIAARVAEMQKKKVAKGHVIEVYRELSRDPSIKGVGITAIPGNRPEQIVPRDDFPRRALDSELEIEEGEKRVRVAEERVRLISPVLLPGNRRWRFSGSTGEFGAPIKDERFLDQVLNGRAVVPMVTGIEMVVMLEVVEVQSNSVWQIAERNVLQVKEVFPPKAQGTLDLTPPTMPMPKKKPADYKDNNGGDN